MKDFENQFSIEISHKGRETSRSTLLEHRKGPVSEGFPSRQTILATELGAVVIKLPPQGLQGSGCAQLHDSRYIQVLILLSQLSKNYSEITLNKTI